MQIFEARGERDFGRVRVQATGELDLATVPRLETCVHEQVQSQTRTTAVELDLRQVGFIDSTGVRLLLTLEAEGRRDGWTLTILPSDPVRRIVTLLRLDGQLLAPQLQAVRPAPPSAHAA